LINLQDYFDKLKANIIVRGPFFPEPVQVITTIPTGDSIKLIGISTQTNETHQPILSLEQLVILEFLPESEPFDIDAHKFRLGNIELSQKITIAPGNMGSVRIRRKRHKEATNPLNGKTSQVLKA